MIVITEFGAVKAERPVFCLDENHLYHGIKTCKAYCKKADVCILLLAQLEKTEEKLGPCEIVPWGRSLNRKGCNEISLFCLLYSIFMYDTTECVNALRYLTDSNKVA